MITSHKELMRLTKKELIEIIHNLNKSLETSHFDNKTLEDDLNEMMSEKEDLLYKADKAELLEDLIHSFKTSRERYFSGIETELEDMEKYLSEIVHEGTK